MKAVKELKGARLDAFLDQWRQDIRNELKTNKSGLLPSKKPSLAASLADDFPSLPVLMSYADPLTSENTSQKGNRPSVWRNDPDPMRIASLCELYFEWGVKDVIVHRFRTVLWPGIVCRAVRRAVMDKDARRHPPNSVRHPGSEEKDDDTATPPSPTKQISSAFSSLALSSPSKKSSASGSSTSDPSASESFTLSTLVPLTSPTSPSPSCSASPSSPTPPAPPLLLEVLSQRTHVSTDSTLEYRVLVDPTSLVQRAESGVKGLRPPLVGGLFGVDSEDENDDDGTHGQDADESGSDGDADVIERLETAASAAAKSGTKKRRARREVPTKPLRLWLPACMIRAAASALVEAYEEKVRMREEKKAKRGTKGVRGRRAGTGVNSTSRKAKVKDDSDNESVPGPPTPKRAAGSKVKSKAVRIGGGGRRRKPKQASEAQDDAYELIDLSAGESPCSSDGEGVKANTKGKGKTKTKTGQTDAMEAPTGAGTKTDATNRKAVPTDTMKEFFNTTKPSIARTTKSKPSTFRPPARKASTVDPVHLRRVFEEEEEDSADAVIPPPLPKSLRPLDLLRAKHRSGTAASNPTSKSKPKTYEESSSSSPPPQRSGSQHLSSLPSRPAQSVPQPRKKPLFVDVSDTDSDIEVSDIRRPLSGAIAGITEHDVAKGKTSICNGDAVSLNVIVGTTY